MIIVGVAPERICSGSDLVWGGGLLRFTSGSASVRFGSNGGAERRANMSEMEDGTSTTRLNPESGERFLPLRRQLGVTSFGMNQIVLEPGQRGRIHRHERQEEVYLVLEGRLTLVIESEPTELGEGELIRVAPDVRRQLVNYGPARVVLVAVGAANEHQGRDGEAFASWEDESPVSPQEMQMPPDLEPGELRS